MIAALVLAAVAARGPQLVPESARFALVLENRAAVPALQSLLETAGAQAPGLTPAEVGQQLRQTVGVDLLDEDARWGLAPGARALVAGDHAVGLSAPVSDPRAARRMLAAFIYAQDERRPRAGVVSGGRLVVASGKRAKDLVALLSRPKDALSTVVSLRPALARARGPLWLYFRAPDPLRAGVFAVEASAQGLVLRGLLQPFAAGALLAPTAAPACDGGLACLSLTPGALGRALLQLAAADLSGRAFAHTTRDGANRTMQAIALTAERVVLRLDGLDVRALAGPDDSLWALRWSGTAAKGQVESVTLRGARPVCVERDASAVHLSSPCGPSPALTAGPAPLSGALDLLRFDAALAKLTPLDALRGEVAAFAYGAHLLYGNLLRHAGPLTVRGSPAKDLPDAAELELRLPLH